MKKIAFLFVLIICFHFTYGQIAKSKNIPWLVENTFQQLYPSADKVKWKKELIFDANDNLIKETKD